MNPIKASDLYDDDGSLRKLIAELEMAQAKLKELRDSEVKDASALEAILKKLNATTAAQREEIEATAKQAEEIEKRYKKYNESLGENAVKIEALKVAQSKLNTVNKLQAQINASVEGSYENLEAQFKLNVIRLKQMSEEMIKNTKEGKELEKSTKDLDKRMKEFNASTKSQKEEVKKSREEIIRLRLEESKKNQITKLTIKLNDAAEGSYDKLAAQYALNKIKLNALGDEERRLTDEGRELVKTTEDIYERMKELQEETGKHTLSVGDYEKAWRSLSGQFGGVVDGVEEVGGAFKALLRNPIVLFISLIVGGLAALFGAFTKSEKGAQLMARASGVLSGVMSQLVKISVSLYDAIVGIFEDPLGSIKGFGEALVNNVLNRFKALIDIVFSVGRSIKALVERDMDALKNAANEVNTAFVQLSTGLDAEQQKNFANAVKETVEEVVKEADALGALEVKKREVIKSNRELVKSIEKLTTEEGIYQSIVDDTTKSFKEREEAAEGARRSLEARAKKEIELARNNLSVINEELKIRRGNKENVEALLDAQLSAYQGLAAAEREYTLSVRQNERERSELKQDRLERDLDILIDGFDNQSTINQEIIKGDRLTFEEKKKLLKETVKLSDDSFRKQIETIQKFTGIAVDANSLIGESDAVVLNEKIRSLGLSEIIEGRLLEIVRDRKSANNDLRTTEEELLAAEKKRLAEEVKAAEKRAKAEAAAEAKRKKDLLSSETQKINELKALSDSEIALIEGTSVEKEKLTLRAEKEKLVKLLDINKRFNEDFSEVQIQTVKNQIAAIDAELDKIEKPNVGDDGLLALLGFEGEELEGVKTAVDFAKEQLQGLADFRKQIADQNVSLANTEVEEAQRALDAQIQNRNAGFAHNASTAAKELEEAKKNQKKALKEQEKAQRAQLALQTIQDASNLASASAKIFAQFGNPFISIPLIATMFGFFAASKIKAFQLSKKKFGKGTYQKLKGGSHASGNDIPLGFEVSGQPAYAEGGEDMAIFSRKAVSQYGGLLPDLVNAINRGTLEEKMMSMGRAASDVPINVGGASLDSSRMEGYLGELVGQGKNERYYQDSRGRMVKVRGNVKTTYL